MSIPLTINGATFEYPVNFDENWGIDATGWAQAVTNGMLQRAGGSFPLLAEIDFGTSFGLKALYLKSHETNIANTGIIRLANASTGLVWRNGTNTGDLSLTTDASNNLLFNGVAIGSSTSLTNSHIFVGNASNVPTDVPMSGDVHITNTGATTVQPATITSSKIAANTITESNIVAGTLTNASISAIAAIVLSKLAALNPFIVPTTDSSGFLTNSATTTTELGYVHGVTSNIQTQINMITGAGQFVSGMGMPFFGGSIPSGWLLCDGSAISRSTFSSLFSAIGTTYGPGDGFTTFNLPQGQNFTFVGKGGSIAPSLGSTSGSTTHTLTVAEIPAGLTVTDPGHIHSIPVFQQNATNGTNIFATTDAVSNGASATNSSTTGISVGGGGTAHSIVQPSLGINWIIKT